MSGEKPRPDQTLPNSTASLRLTVSRTFWSVKSDKAADSLAVISFVGALTAVTNSPTKGSALSVSWPKTATAYPPPMEASCPKWARSCVPAHKAVQTRSASCLEDTPQGSRNSLSLHRLLVTLQSLQALTHNPTLLSNHKYQYCRLLLRRWLLLVIASQPINDYQLNQGDVPSNLLWNHDSTPCLPSISWWIRFLLLKHSQYSNHPTHPLQSPQPIAKIRWLGIPNCISRI